MTQPEPVIGYLDDGALILTMQRFCVFNPKRPREQVGLLAFDRDHAELEGSLALSLPRHRVHVIQAPGHLDSSGLA